MLTKEQKLKVVAGIRRQSENYGSANKQAVAIGIAGSQLSRILKGDVDGVLSDANWVTIARKCGVELSDEFHLKTAQTAVFKHIWAQLKFAQENSVSGILCDRADIGKTHTALMYARENRHVAYVDCSRAKSKMLLIRAIAKEFGLVNSGRYIDLFDDLVMLLRSMRARPLIILDEFGDLHYPAYLEFKALWNATDGRVGWYAMGADGLAHKLNRQISNLKVGFAEIFSRLGNKYQRITPHTEPEFKQFQKKQIAQIGLANDCKDVQRLHAKTNMSLRRIPIQLSLERRAENDN